MGERVVVELASWTDPGFVADWYPRNLPARERLDFYAQRFEAVELNSSFYAIPQRRTVERWVKQTPSTFGFDVKLHRALSRHAATPESLPPDLRGDVEVGDRGRVTLTPELEHELISNLLEAFEPLIDAGRLSSFLLQLSPGFAPASHTLSELNPLLVALREHRVAVEFRHRGWVDPERVEATLAFLGDRDAAFVCVDAPGALAPTIMPALDAVTRRDLAYLRLHGRNAEGYLRGRTVAERFGWVYSDSELREISSRVDGLLDEAEQVRVIFNNNRSDDAPIAARRFRELRGQSPGPAPDSSGQGRLL